MSYRCGLCRGLVPPKTPMRRYVVYRGKTELVVIDHRLRPRVRQEVEREIPVCVECERVVKSLDDLYARAQVGREREKGERALREQRDRLRIAAARNGFHKSAPKRVAQVVNRLDQLPPMPPTPEGLWLSDDAVKRLGKELRDYPECDVCGKDATHGQVTDHTVLCPEHCEKAKGK